MHPENVYFKYILIRFVKYTGVCGCVRQDYQQTTLDTLHFAFPTMKIPKTFNPQQTILLYNIIYNTHI